MSFRTAARQRFDQLVPQYFVLERWMGEQVEWFMNKAGNLIGIVAERKGEPYWSYIILRQDQTGGLRISDVRSNFFSRTAATVDLLHQMAAAERSGYKAVTELEP